MREYDTAKCPVAENGLYWGNEWKELRLLGVTHAGKIAILGCTVKCRGTSTYPVRNNTLQVIPGDL